MSIIVISWSMVASLAFSMGVIQSLIWTRSPRHKAPLLAALMTYSAGALALLEMFLAKNNDIETAQILLRWMNTFIFLLLMSMIWFVHIYLKSNRKWLLYLITLIWTFCVVVNWLLPGNLTFSSLRALIDSSTFWGETWHQPVGEDNVIRPISDFATLLIIIYVMDATIQSYRSINHREALVTGGSIIFFIIVAGIQTPLVDAQVIQTPYMISWAFVAIGCALGLEIVDQASKSAVLNHRVIESEQRWRTLLENVELGVIGFSLDGKITFANRFVERLLDYGAGDLVGENVINLAPNHLREELTARLDRARRLGARSQVDFPLVSKGGDTKEIRWSFVSLRNDNDEISGYLAICDDLTALKRAEAALRSSEREIERFDRAALMVEIGASLGHELNQPLAAILINGQTGKRMLGSDPVPLEDIAEIFTDIIDDTTRAGRVVESVRGILRRGEMKQVASDLKPLFEEVNHILRGELLKKRIKIIIDFQDNLPKVFVGRIEIQQVFLNILNNSVRILNSNGVSNPSIKVSAHRSGEMVKIRVSDNGPGIAEPTLRKIFDPFVTSRADGLGMGLAISRRIVDLHGGCLHCESRLGNGACFEFTLPIAFNGRGSVDGRESTDSLYH